ncbi:hypothetical protein T492DRAFT_1007998 [Pavlovales sp. CCMP2436]|nr:hypothetical protein T492DRAFT_1007998 [Pavlovales sp. CCMP2436]
MMSLLSGAFQVGSLLFLLMEVAEASFPDSASRLVLLCTHAAIGLAVGLVGTCIWPDKPFGTGGSKPSEEQVTHGAITPGHTAPETNTDLQPSPPPPPLHLASFWEQARSPEYQLVLIFFASNVLPAQFTVGTIGVQLERKGDVNGVHTRAYSIIFASAALAAPLAGMAIDRYGFPPVMAAINAALAISYAVLMVPLLSIQPIAYVAYSVGRVCLWALWFAYVAAEFGFKNYGKLAGGGLAIGAMFSLLQYAALEAVVRLGGGDFLAINGVWCALSCSMFAVIYELHRRERRCSQAAQV